MESVANGEKFFSSILVKAILLILRVLLFPVPFRVGIYFSLNKGETNFGSLKLNIGPWPGGSKRAVFHLIIDAKDWEFWKRRMKITRAALKKPKEKDNASSGKSSPDKASKAILSDKYHFLRRPGIFKTIEILRGLTGGFRFIMTGNDNEKHTAYLIFNHRSPQPPINLLTAEFSEAVADQILKGEVNFSTALIQQTVYVHGNASIVGMLEKLLPAPIKETFKPMIYSERSDHPIDKGYKLSQQFQIPPLKSCCILRIDGAIQKGAEFDFACCGYDVYSTRELGMAHEYDTSEDIPWEPITLRFSWISPNVFRIRCVRGVNVPDNQTPMLIGPVPQPSFKSELIEYEDRFELPGPELRVVIYRRNFRIEVFGPNGRVTVMGQGQKSGFMNIVDTLPTGFFKDIETGCNFTVNNFQLEPGEAVFGFGEQYGTVNKRGQTVSLWTEEGMGHSTGRNYKNVPFFMTTAGYGVFLNHYLPMTFFVGSRFFPRLEIAAEGDMLDQFFFFGPSLKRVQGSYTELTGKAPMIPKWSLGLWVSRISYLSEEQVLEVARKLREENWPADVIHVDTGWFKAEWQCDWQFDRNRFPDPKGMIEKMRAKNLHLSLWQWPYVVDTLPLAKEAAARGAIARGKTLCMGIKMLHIDFTKPEGVTFYQELLEPLLKMGVDAIKTDFGEYVEDYIEFAGGPGRQFKNVFPLLYNKAAFEVSEKVHPGNAILWSRSAYAGSQRYPVHWSGDSGCTFEDMVCALRSGLSFGLSGFTFWSNDVGGFCGVPSDELYARWTAWSIFNSHMRLHGGPPRYREPWNFSPETQIIFRELVGLRYRLIPYLYTEAKASAREGLPVLRHLAFEFQDDPTSWNIDDQFMFGESIMVAPILSEKNSRNVWIPPGVWFDAWNGEKIEGPRWIQVTAELDKVPFYYRGGHAVLMGPDIRYVDEKTEPITIKIFPDKNGRSIKKIEDDKGIINIETIIIGNTSKISISGPARDYTFEIYGADSIEKIEVNGKEIRDIKTSKSNKIAKFSS